ncbi:hypothetical protein EHO59_07140 [Leptospira semungkisensis]|uniref:Uncharacterized protein n=1 Tax=Leptospira semungkisensis TaxID=2484985 RepID=A0A4R9G8A4_9LEPT|nr:hypothetical protein [Leptospira semungkisensis]TGK07862.1 hypothetical protein EHO59_07140 [Leptospira semungkisensis]
MKRSILGICLSALFALSFANCDGLASKGSDNSLSALALAGLGSSTSWPPASVSCETDLESSYTTGTYATLCTPASGTDSVHFRVEGLEALGFNGYFYLFKGPSAAPASTSTASGSGNLALVHGRNTGDTNSNTWTKFGADGNYQAGDSSTVFADATFGNPGPSELCVDIVRRSGKTPRAIIWVTGKNNANCKVKNTLKEANATKVISNWTSETVSLASGTGAYFRFSNTSLLTAKKIVVSSVTATDTTECNTSLSSVTTPQALCEPDAGTGKHYRFNGIQLSGNHVAFCMTKGWSDASCMTAAGTGQFKFTLYSGGPPPPPMSYVDFSTEEVNTSSVPSFKTSSADICYDLTQTSPPRVTVWATGTSGADCGNKSSLTASNSILNKSDWVDTSIPGTGTSYATISNTTGTTPGTVTVSSDSVLP